MEQYLYNNGQVNECPFNISGMGATLPQHPPWPPYTANDKAVHSNPDAYRPALTSQFFAASQQSRALQYIEPAQSTSFNHFMQTQQIPGMQNVQNQYSSTSIPVGRVLIYPRLVAQSMVDLNTRARTQRSQPKAMSLEITQWSKRSTS